MLCSTTREKTTWGTCYGRKSFSTLHSWSSLDSPFSPSKMQETVITKIWGLNGLFTSTHFQFSSSSLSSFSSAAESEHFTHTVKSKKSKYLTSRKSKASILIQLPFLLSTSRISRTTKTKRDTTRNHFRTLLASKTNTILELHSKNCEKWSKNLTRPLNALKRIYCKILHCKKNDC